MFYTLRFDNSCTPSVTRATFISGGQPDSLVPCNVTFVDGSFAVSILMIHGIMYISQLACNLNGILGNLSDTTLTLDGITLSVH